MPEYIKALIYILIVVTPGFIIAKKLAVPFIPMSEFRMWRNTWYAATCAVFLSGSLMLYLLFLVPLAIFIHKRAANPVFLYIILLFVTPCFMIVAGIPGVIGKILDINPPRILTLLILVPIAFRLWKDKANRVFSTADMLVGGFVLLLCVLALRNPPITTTGRMIIGYFLDIGVPYFVFSRSLRTPQDINRALLAFVVAVMPFAAVGLFEVLKNWRVYNIAAENWGLFLTVPYLFRDGMLRAAVTAIEPISAGFVCVVGGGCLLAYRGQKVAHIWRLAALGIICAGLLASISRGPWLGFAVCCVIMGLSRPKLAFKVAFASALPALVFALSSSARLDRFINLLPFVGHADPSSESYRSQLFTNSMIVIERYPLFGSTTYLMEPEMQRMIQGQGIIDLVNTYLQVALDYGIAGLVLFAGFFLYLAIKLFGAFMAGDRPDLSYSGLLGILMGILFIIMTTSSVTFIPYIYMAFAGICVAALRMRDQLAPNTVTPTQTDGDPSSPVLALAHLPARSRVYGKS